MPDLISKRIHAAAGLVRCRQHSTSAVGVTVSDFTDIGLSKQEGVAEPDLEDRAA